jgi:putative ABC transport system ATP-binding protein
MALFEVKNLCKTFENAGVKTPVLRDITFQIDRGEFVSIMGPSGSGKSTLLHILGFLSDPTSGSFIFNKKPIENYSEEEAALVRNKEMGFVFQTFNLLGRSTVYDNVRLPLLYSDRPESEWHNQVKSAIKHVGLSHRANYQTSKLSGGEKQRTAIARALVNQPRVIFADEPTGNLDSVSGGSVMKTLQNLHEKFGHTIVLITHETRTAEHAERIIEIHDGSIISDNAITKRRIANAGFEK